MTKHRDKNKDELNIRDQFQGHTEKESDQHYSVRDQFSQETLQPQSRHAKPKSSTNLPGNRGTRRKSSQIRKEVAPAEWISTLDYLKIVKGILRKKRVIAACTLLFFIPALVGGIRLAKKADYSASAKLLYNPKNSKGISIGVGRQPLLSTFSKNTMVNMLTFSRNMSELSEALKGPFDAGELKDRLSIDADRRSDLIKVSISGMPDEKTALQALNQFLDIAVKNSGEVYRDQAREMHTEFQAQLAEAESRKNKLDAEIEAFQIKNQMLEMGVQNTVYFEALNSISERISQARIDNESLKVRITNYREMIKKLPDEVMDTSKESDPLRGKISNLEVALMNARARYAADNPKIKQIERDIAEAKALMNKEDYNQLRQQTYIPNPVKKEFEAELLRLETEEKVSQEQLTQLTKELEKEQQKFKELPRLEQQFALLLAQRTQLDELYNSLLARERAAELSIDTDMADFAVAEYAHKAVPAGSLLAKALPVAGLMFGLAGGVFLALMLELLDLKIRTPKQLDALYRIPCLCVLPSHPELTSQNAAEFSLPILRELGDRLDVMLNGEPSKSLGFLSSIEGEGKSLLSFQLARYYHTLGVRTLYIDFNATVNPMLPAEEPSWKPADLDEYLLDQASLDDLIRHVEGMDVIKQQKHRADMLELMKRPAMTRLWDALTDKYDLVILEAPAVLDHPTFNPIAHLLDHFIYVVSAENCDRKLLNAGIEQLEKRGLEPLGFALNQADPYYLNTVQQMRNREPTTAFMKKWMDKVETSFVKEGMDA